MDDDVVCISDVKEAAEEETESKSERIKTLEADLQKEKELRNELELCNGELRIKIAELQKEITSWEEGKKGVVDVATQTDGHTQTDNTDEVTELNADPSNEIPKQVEVSIADSIRDAAEAAMSNSGFVYDENSGLYYDYTSGYYYNPENHLYYDTKTGIYYYFNETSNAYEFHSQVEIPEQTQQETEDNIYRRKKKERGKGKERRKDMQGKDRFNPEHVNVKNHKRKRKENRDRSERGHRDKGGRSREGKQTDEIRERRKEKKHKKNKYEDSQSDEQNRRKHKVHRKHKKRKAKKKSHSKDEGDIGKDLKIVEYKSSEEEQTMMHDGIKSDGTKNDMSHSINDNSSSKHETNETDIIVICSGESDIEEGEIEGDVQEIKDVEEGEIKDVEEGEIPSSSSRRSSSERSSLSDISSESMTDISDEEMNEGNEEEAKEEMEEEIQQVNRREYPPCIRMIVTKSESIQPGSLYIITCMGGSIGREGSEHTVIIPELAISKSHAQIFYCQQSWQYYIRDLGSQNGTLINSKSLAQPRTESDAHILSHKDYLTIGGTVLRLHIHAGAETCDECEPGQVQALLAQNQPKAPVTLAPDKDQQRRKGLKEIKKKYGLARDKYVDKDSSTTANPAYTDRATVRRKTVGSDNPHQKDDLPASVDREIGTDNLGRKMMEKMGWKSGETLGKDNTGIKEPINVLSNNKRAGLGGQAQRTINDLAQGNLASEKWDKARARYDALAGPKTISMKLGQSSNKIAMKWTSGGVMKPPCKKENIFGSDDEEEEGEDVVAN